MDKAGPTDRWIVLGLSRTEKSPLTQTAPQCLWSSKVSCVHACAVEQEAIAIHKDYTVIICKLKDSYTLQWLLPTTIDSFQLSIYLTTGGSIHSMVPWHMTRLLDFQVSFLLPPPRHGFYTLQATRSGVFEWHFRDMALCINNATKVFLNPWLELLTAHVCRLYCTVSFTKALSVVSMAWQWG